VVTKTVSKTAECKSLGGSTPSSTAKYDKAIKNIIADTLDGKIRWNFASSPSSSNRYYTKHKEKWQLSIKAREPLDINIHKYGTKTSYSIGNDTLAKELLYAIQNPKLPKDISDWLDEVLD